MIFFFDFLIVTKTSNKNLFLPISNNPSKHTVYA